MNEQPDDDLGTGHEEMTPSVCIIMQAAYEIESLLLVLVRTVRTLLLENDRKENVLLCSVRFKNPDLFQKVIHLLVQLQLGNLIVESYDIENNNTLQLATIHYQQEIFETVFDHFKKLGGTKLTEAIMHRNFADENCMTIALSERSQAPQSVAVDFEHVTTFDSTNIKSILAQDIYGLNTIMHAVQANEWRLVKYLLAHVKDHCGVRILTSLFISEAFSMTSDSGHNDVSGNEAGCKGETVFKRLLNIRNGIGLTADVDDILGDFLLFTVTGVKQYNLATSQLPYSNRSILSHLIEHKCQGLIDKLQERWGYGQTQEVKGELARLLHLVCLGAPTISYLFTRETGIAGSTRNFSRTGHSTIEAQLGRVLGYSCDE